ncbi:MAG: xanthine dehydrogenase family protein subunit M [Rhodothermales bacterium]|nr:xanthine dehydrogenase family protein subunit M [Rhodothermales bacterium]
MKPPPFRYAAPETEAEALALLAEHGPDAVPLAGGQSLVPAMNFRLARPAVLVDLNRIETLTPLYSTDDGGLRLGAMVRQRTAERDPRVAERAPLLAAALACVAHPPIRNRGTVGGSLAHADPAAELPAVMLALGARLCLRSVRGDRWLDAADFYTAFFSTAREPDELLAEIALPPPPPRSGWAFREVARRHGDYALVGVAAHVALDERGRCRTARLALLSVGDGPTPAPSAARLLVGETPTPEGIRAAAEAIDHDIDPGNDIHATAGYRRHLARVLVEDVLTQAFARVATGT